VALISAEIIETGAAIGVGWGDGTTARFHAIWLRDNALDAATRDPRNGQKLLRLDEIAPEIAVAEAWIGGSGVEIAFSDGHRTAFPSEWLRAHAYDRPPSRAAVAPGKRMWRGGDLTLRSAGYAQLTSMPQARRDWLRAIARDGVAHVTGLAQTSGSLEEVVALFGYVRETNYGRFFDLRTVDAPTNLGFTNLALQMHTDNPYRVVVPGILVLSCLENTVSGGENSLMDGFAAVDALRQEDPEAVALLSTYPAAFEYAGAQGVRLRATHRVVDCDADGAVQAVRFNNRAFAAPVDVPFAQMAAWYGALQRLVALFDDPAFAFRLRLAPGEALVLDNSRILHARTAFSSAGARWLQGCYADLDSFYSTLASLEDG